MKKVLLFPFVIVLVLNFSCSREEWYNYHEQEISNSGIQRAIAIVQESTPMLIHGSGSVVCSNRCVDYNNGIYCITKKNVVNSIQQSIDTLLFKINKF